VYGFNATPSIAIDGNWQVVGDYGSCAADANAYRNAINARLNATGGQSPVAVSGVYSVDGGTITLTATFELLDAVTLVSPKAYLTVTESDLHYSSYTFNHVVRAGASEAVTLTNPGDQVTITKMFPVGAWNMNNLHCVAFLQRTTGTLAQKQVYQAAELPMVADYRFLFDCSIGSAPHGSSPVEFTGTLTNIGDATDDLTISLTNNFGWPAEFKLASEGAYHTTPVTIGLGPDQSIGVSLRVTTDADVRTGTGSLTFTSANSERTQVNPATVYNGSPSIMFVDDDGMYNYGALVTNALTANGYLYTAWDCYNEHGNAGPTLDDMKCFDVVIWHQGYETGNLLSVPEMEAIMDYMDNGKGFILSSQDILTQANSPELTALKSNYLGIASFTINVGATHATGVAGDPVTDGMSFDLTYPYSSWNRADKVVPNAYASAIFSSQTTANKIAIRCDNGTAKSVFLAFQLNAMSEVLPDPNNPKTLLRNAIDWVLPAGPASGVSDETYPMVASNIRSITPNPFSPAGDMLGSTTIRLRVSERAADRMARLDVVDINGRVVCNVLNRALPLGVSDASWDGRDTAGDPVSAGVYYLRFETADGTHSARTVVIR
jgi:flagellar hook assembly protein FlgD